MFKFMGERSSVGEEAGAEAPRALDGLLVAPCGYARFVAAEEYVGHAPAFVVGGTGVDGRFEQAVLKGVL